MQAAGFASVKREWQATEYSLYIGCIQGNALKGINFMRLPVLNHRNRQKAGRREVFKQPLIQGIKNTEDYKSKWKNYAERCENEQTS